MGLALYDLAGAEEDRRFSPYCWRITLALKHKGLDFESIPWRFTEKDKIAFAGTDKVPVLVDGEVSVHDSPAIAAYLEKAYPDRPSLFGGQAAQALSRFHVDWTDLVLQPALFRMIIADIPPLLAPNDADYFRRSREARVGASLEDFCAGRDAKLAALHQLLSPLRRTLTHHPFLSGEKPAWADYTVFGAFQWSRCVSPIRLIEDKDDPVYRWRDAMLGLYDGLAGKAKGFPV
jgi:glutathione S-transferase